MMIRKIALTIMNFVLFGSPVTGQAIQKELTRTHAYVQDAKPTQSSKILEGEWKGTLEAGGQKLRLVIRVTKGSGEKLSGAMDSLDQGANDIPISSVEQSGDQVS
jgi:hypothetical protein